jgi:plastocyanin
VAAALAAWPGAMAAAGTLTGAVKVSEFVGDELKALEDNSLAVIFLTGFREAALPGRKPQLAQKNKSFSERVLVVTQGETVAFPNLDGIHHNVWSKSEAKSFDLGLFKYPESRAVTFDRPGIVTVFCNIHPQMISTILALPNNKYAVTGPAGTYQIDGIKPGEYSVYAWVEGAKPERKSVTIQDGKPAELNFSLSLRRIPIRHLNKEGKLYEKY